MHAALLALLVLGPLLDTAPGVGDGAPPLELETLDGRPFPRARLAGGGVTLVDFFATWCKPCHQAMADLVAVRKALGPRVRFILIDVNEDAATVNRFLHGRALPEGAEVALDRTGGMGRRWGQDRFPTAFLVDDTGIIRHINRGWGPGYQTRMRDWLRAMLAPGGPTVRAVSAKPAHREMVKGVEILRGE